MESPCLPTKNETNLSCAFEATFLSKTARKASAAIRSHFLPRRPPRDEGVTVLTASLTQNLGPGGFDSSERKAPQGRIQYGHCGRKFTRPCPEEKKRACRFAAMLPD